MTTQYNIDLRTSEIVMLRRALAGEAKFYQELMVKSEPQWEKDEMKKRIQAVEQLSERLFYEMRPADTVGPAVIDRIKEELRTMDHSEFTNDAAGWERATEALVKSLTK